MNEENEWDQNVQADLVEGPPERVSREEVVKALGKMKAGKAAAPSEVSVEMIAASGEIGVDVMVELCHSVLDGRRMPDEWALSVVVPVFKGKGDATSCLLFFFGFLYFTSLESTKRTEEDWEPISLPGTGLRWLTPVCFQEEGLP